MAATTASGARWPGTCPPAGCSGWSLLNEGIVRSGNGTLYEACQRALPGPPARGVQEVAMIS